MLVAFKSVSLCLCWFDNLTAFYQDVASLPIAFYVENHPKGTALPRQTLPIPSKSQSILEGVAPLGCSQSKACKGAARLSLKASGASLSLLTKPICEQLQAPPRHSRRRCLVASQPAANSSVLLSIYALLVAVLLG